jgi:hypothetical protein
MDALEAHLQRQIAHSRTFFWHRIRWDAVDDQLDGDGFALTDVGAGIGLVAEFLATSHPKATYSFVEPLDSLVTELERRHGSEANHNGAATYAGSRYITLLDVLEHIEDDRGFLADLATKMDPGATLIMTVPALVRLWSSWDVALGHYRRYDKAMVRERFAPLPFRIREVSYLFPEMLAPAILRRRRRRTTPEPSDADLSAEFPDLSPPVNDLLYRLGTVTLRNRRRWPAGTSVLVVADRV